MRRLVLWAVLAASLSANVAMAVVAVRQRAGASPGEPLVFSRIAVDPEQRARIVDLRGHLLARRDEHARELERLRGDLAEVMTRRASDRPEIERIVHRISDTQGAFQREIVDHVLAVQAVLRPDQRPAFAEVVAKHMQTGNSMQCGFGPAGEVPAHGGRR